MSTMKHTPGPWRIELGRYGVPRAIRGPESAEFRNIINWNGLSSPSRPESVANARLIAAAPDLLEALEMLADPMRTPTDGDPSVLREFARAAIAKAKGES